MAGSFLGRTTHNYLNYPVTVIYTFLSVAVVQRSTQYVWAIFLLRVAEPAPAPSLRKILAGCSISGYWPKQG